MEMCRACLTTGEDLVPMDEAFVNNYNLLTNLNLILNEIPLYSCNICFDAVKFCMEFREKCISSDLTLKEILFPNCLPNVKEDAKVNKIKEEVKLEYESDSNIWEDFYNEPFVDYNLIKTKEDEDWAPKKTLKQTQVKKAMRTKRESITQEKIKNCDETMALHCGICSKNFDDSRDLATHLEHHKFDNNCGLCLEQFIDFPHLLAHRLVHLPRKQKVCYLCPRKFITAGPDVMEFHYVEQHKLRGDNGRLLCKLCLSPFDCPKNLRHHIKAVHSDIKYTCKECGKGFRIKQVLTSHMNLHRDEKAYECDLCDYTSKFATGVRSHKLRKHTADRVYCKTCGRVFGNQAILEKHTCKHLLGAICPVCGKYISKPSKLSHHIKSHSETPRYECGQCPSKFKSRGAFQAHKNRHAGTRPFRCEHCPMRFFSHPPLIKHRRTHTGEKPYVCDICQKGFTGNHNLKVHMKVHGFNNLIAKKTSESETHIF